MFFKVIERNIFEVALHLFYPTLLLRKLLHTSNKEMVGIHENKLIETNATSRTNGKNREEINRIQPTNCHELSGGSRRPSRFTAFL